MPSVAAVAAALVLVVSDASADDKRAPQDYGAPDEPTTAGDVLVWPPRVVLFPLWLLTEFVFRRPIGWVVQSAEKGRWIQNAQDLLTFGSKDAPLGEFAIFPSALLDFGLVADRLVARPGDEPERSRASASPADETGDASTPRRSRGDAVPAAA